MDPFKLQDPDKMFGAGVMYETVNIDYLIYKIVIIDCLGSQMWRSVSAMIARSVMKGRWIVRACGEGTWSWIV